MVCLWQIDVVDNALLPVEEFRLTKWSSTKCLSYSVLYKRNRRPYFIHAYKDNYSIKTHLFETVRVQISTVRFLVHVALSVVRRDYPSQLIIEIDK